MLRSAAQVVQEETRSQTNVPEKCSPTVSSARAFKDRALIASLIIPSTTRELLRRGYRRGGRAGLKARKARSFINGQIAVTVVGAGQCSVVADCRVEGEALTARL